MEFRRARYRDIPLIQSFICNNYQREHVLGNSKALFIHEYLNSSNNLNQNQMINFYLAQSNNELLSIIGFYEQSKEICLSMWVSKKQTMAGIQLLNYVEKEFVKPIVVVGISKEAKKIYQALNFQFGKLQYYGYLNSEQQIIETKSKFNDTELKSENLIYPYEEYVRRVKDNPFRDYEFIKIKQTIFVYRLIRGEFALIVDVIGSLEKLEQKIKQIPSRLNVRGVSIWTNQILELELCTNQAFNFSCSDINRKLVSEIDYCTNDSKTRFITKLWADQDRPARLNDKYAIVNNFMYHFVRDDNSVSHRCTTRQFKQDVEYLLKTYKPIRIIDLRTGKFDPLEEYFAVSFDDYYEEHEKFIAPFLNKCRIEGQFFVPDNQHKILKVNKVQQIIKYVKHDVIWNILNSRRILVQKLTCNNTYDDDEILGLKRTLQTCEDDIIDQLYQQCPKNVSYGSNPAQLSGKHFVGSHMVSHSHMTKQTKEAIIHELLACDKDLPLSLSSTAKGMAYPYGSYNQEIIDLVQQHGYVFAWTTNRSYGVIGTKGNLTISRYDCNDLKALSSSKDLNVLY